MRIKPPLATLAVVAAALVGATGVLAARQGPAKAKATVKISTRKVAGLGRVLTNSRGLTLYMFVPDKRKKVTCVSVCARIWPPVKLPAGAKISASGGVKAKLLKSDKDPAGGRVVTYDRWPLYTYAGDRKPGVATGQALNLNGGLWYVLATSGKVIKTKLHSAAAHANSAQTTTTTAPLTGGGTPTTTTTPSGGSVSSAPPSGPDGCPGGTTIAQNTPTTGGDGDVDDTGQQSDGDGCV
jgi:predicted lipoprotein with Yx(FWY)xxD motif